jgi:hypothetical protein
MLYHRLMQKSVINRMDEMDVRLLLKRWYGLFVQ